MVQVSFAADVAVYGQLAYLILKAHADGAAAVLVCPLLMIEAAQVRPVEAAT